MHSSSVDAMPSHPLHLADECMIFPGENVLYVLSRLGSFELRGRRIHVLHERMQRYFDGAHTEGELLAAVPSSQAPALRTYFARLREVGALSTGTSRQHSQERSQVREPRRPAAHTLPAAEQVATALPARRRDVADQPHRLLFATPEQAGRLLLRFPNRTGASLTCVVAEPFEKGPHSVEQLEQRAVYARWLRRNQRHVAGPERRLRLFRLDGGTGALTRMLDVRESEATGPSTLLDRLDVIRRADVDQIPLIVLTASHPYFRPTVNGYGVSYPLVHSYTARAFVARALLWPTKSKPFCTFRSGALGAPARTYVPVRVARAQTASMLTAPSWLQLRFHLLEEFVSRSLPAEAAEVWAEVDILREQCSNPAVVLLQDMLRLRLPSLWVHAGMTSHGLSVFRHQGLAGSSFIREKAILELLLAAAWAEFYAEAPVSDSSPPSMACDPLDFVTAEELNHLVKTLVSRLRRQGESARVVVRRLRCWGTAVWVGALASCPAYAPAGVKDR